MRECGVQGLLAAAPFHNPPPHWVCQPPPCCESSLPHLPISASPTGLDECFFFISLVVGLPYSSIFFQFWLFFVFKLLLSFFWLCAEAQCVYLCLHVCQLGFAGPSIRCRQQVGCGLCFFSPVVLRGLELGLSYNIYRCPVFSCDLRAPCGPHCLLCAYAPGQCL